MVVLQIKFKTILLYGADISPNKEIWPLNTLYVRDKMSRPKVRFIKLRRVPDVFDGGVSGYSAKHAKCKA